MTLQKNVKSRVFWDFQKNVKKRILELWMQCYDGITNAIRRTPANTKIVMSAYLSEK